MEAVSSSKIWASFCRATWHHIPQVSHRCENLKSSIDASVRYLLANGLVDTARPRALRYGRDPISCVRRRCRDGQSIEYVPNGQELTRHHAMKKQREWKNSSMSL
jgi:hypothetical protein